MVFVSLRSTRLFIKDCPRGVINTPLLQEGEQEETEAKFSARITRSLLTSGFLLPCQGNGLRWLYREIHMKNSRYY